MATGVSQSVSVRRCRVIMHFRTRMFMTPQMFGAKTCTENLSVKGDNSPKTRNTNQRSQYHMYETEGEQNATKDGATWLCVKSTSWYIGTHTK